MVADGEVRVARGEDGMFGGALLQTAKGGEAPQERKHTSLDFAGEDDGGPCSRNGFASEDELRVVDGGGGTVCRKDGGFK